MLYAPAVVTSIGELIVPPTAKLPFDVAFTVPGAFIVFSKAVH